MKEKSNEKPYLGLLGLDNISPTFKAINLLITIGFGVVAAFHSWFQELYINRAIYKFEPFSWPLVFLFAWPVCAIILWLRLTGLKWRWGFLAGGIVFFIYFILTTIINAIAWMMS